MNYWVPCTFFFCYPESGRVLYKLRRHDEAILSFSWCPVQYNVLHKPEKLDEKFQNLKITSKELKEELQNLDVNPKKKLEEHLQNLDLNPKTPSKNADLWRNLKHADDEETSNSRPIPQHFDIADDCFGGEDTSIDLSEKLTPNRQGILKARRNKTQTTDCEKNLEEEKSEDDFLAACAALRKQILDKKPIDTEETKDNCEIESTQTLETTQVSSDDSSNTLCNAEETQPQINVCSVELEHISTKSEKKEYLLASSSRAG